MDLFRMSPNRRAWTKIIDYEEIESEVEKIKDIAEKIEYKFSALDLYNVEYQGGKKEKTQE